MELETLKNELQSKIDKAIESAKVDKEAIASIETKLANAVTKEDLAKVTEDIESIATKIDALKVTGKKENGIAKVEIIQPLKKGAKTQHDFSAQMTVKADVLHNIAVISGGTFDADEANVDSALLTLTANAPLLSGRLSFSDSFLSEILSVATPLEVGQALQYVVLGSDSGAPAQTGEANTKPTVATKLSIEKEEAKKVAHVFYTTTEFLNRMGIYNQFVINNFGVLINNKLKADIYTDIVAKGAAFADPGVETSAAPNNYDALLALSAQMEASGYTPTHVFMNAVDVNNLVATKAIDGHYAVYNGQSIFLFEGNDTFIILNGNRVKLIKNATNTQAVGSVSMIDVNNVQFGASPSLLYKLNPYSEYFKDNVVEHLMETAFAVLKPSNKPNAIVKGTLSAIKTAITTPE